MIRFPPGFDVVHLVSDFFAFATPFISIAAIFGCAIIIKKAIKQAV